MSNTNLETIAKEVIAGKWGNDKERYQRLTSAGYVPELVQKKVNELLSSGCTAGAENLKRVEIDARGFDGIVIEMVVD